MRALLIIVAIIGAMLYMMMLGVYLASVQNARDTILTDPALSCQKWATRDDLVIIEARFMQPYGRPAVVSESWIPEGGE